MSLWWQLQEMDGTKRKTRSSPTPLYANQPAMDFGSTPPWALSPVYHEESAMRSTQASPQSTIDPMRLQHRTAAQPTHLPSWTPFNQEQEFHLPQGRRRIGKAPPQHVLPQLFDEDEDFDNHVDTSDGNDGVYMINAKEGSWSASLPSEDDPAVRAQLPYQAELALKHIKRAQELAEEQQRLHAANIAMEALLQQRSLDRPSTEEQATQQKDISLRHAIGHIKKKLEQGAILALERIGPINLTMACAHPHCPAPSKFIPPGAYYLILGATRGLNSASRYCLFCFEKLWNANGTVGQPPSPNIYLEEAAAEPKVPSYSLDGAMDDDRLMAAGISPVAVTPSSSIHTSCSSSQDSAFHSISTPRTQRSDAGARTVTSLESYESPLLRKSNYVQVATQEVEDVDSVPQEFLASKSKDLALRSLFTSASAEHGLPRRSTRLRSLATSTQSVVLASRTSSAQRTSTEPIVRIVSPAEVDTLAEDIRKADSRLEAMYEARNNALPLLEPGDSALIKHPRCASEKAKHHISKDMFGIVYTNLLSEHVKYWTKLPVGEKFAHRISATDLVLQGNRRTARFDSIKENAEAVERWCICLGVEDGREMVECGNAKCLIGWYHIECIGGEVDEEDDWICALCSSHETGDGTMPALDIDQKPLKRLLWPPYAQAHIQTTCEDSVLLSGLQRFTAPANIPQIDGGADLPPLPYQPVRPSPLSQTPLRIPESLLSSKHAPRVEALSSSLLEDKLPKLPESPITNHLETPGSLQSSQNSTTSEGEWRHPMTRFQHLASFIKPGNSLDAAEKATVELWKMASEEQLHWNIFRAKYQQMVHELSGRLDSEEDEVDVLGTHGDEEAVELLKVGVARERGANLDYRGVETRPEPHHAFGGTRGDVRNVGNADDDESTLGDEAGLSKKQCRGKNLSAVLAEVRSRWLGSMR